MNIFVKESRSNIKAFLFWSLGLTLLVFAGIAKFEGIKEGGEAISSMMDSFPRIVQAMFGIVGLDVTRLDGYFAILMFYSVLCAAVYGIGLGSKAGGREIADRTSEFIFTKPCGRIRILNMKLLAAALTLAIFCILNAALSFAAVYFFESGADVADLTHEILLFTLDMALVGLLFLLLAAMLSVCLKTPGAGSHLASALLLTAFFLGVIFDMFKAAAPLRPLIPFRYFLPGDIADGNISAVYFGLFIVIGAVFYAISAFAIKKRDM